MPSFIPPSCRPPPVCAPARIWPPPSHGGVFAVFSHRLANAYAPLGPAVDAVTPAVSRCASKGLRPHRFRRALRLLVALVVIAALVYAAWKSKTLVRV